jgi:hypothetical protein
MPIRADPIRACPGLVERIEQVSREVFELVRGKKIEGKFAEKRSAGVASAGNRHVCRLRGRGIA